MIPHGLIWPMIVTMQKKLFTIFNLFIQDGSVASSCSTVTGGLYIIAIMISQAWDQTSVSHQFHYIYYYYDLSTKPRIKWHTKEILNPITDTIQKLQATSRPQQLYFQQIMSYSQWWWYSWCSRCRCWSKGQAGCRWWWQTRPSAEQLTIECKLE